MLMRLTGDTKKDLAAVVKAAYRLSADVGEDVEAIVTEGRELPLTRAEFSRLLTTIISVVKQKAAQRGDKKLANSLEADLGNFVEELTTMRDGNKPNGDEVKQKPLVLTEFNGIKPRPVFPLPVFHGKEMPMK